MQGIVYSYWGMVHLAAAVAALGLGTAVVALPKSGPAHRRLGYAYVGSVSLMLVTAFGIYRQFNGFGIFHVAALLSAATLGAGMVPAVRRKPAVGWLSWHYTFMYASVLELYVALVAEALVRLPSLSFLQVATASLVTVLVPGGILYKRLQRRWFLAESKLGLA